MAGLYYSASVLLALAAAALLWRLSSFPAMSGDEAWIGMMATRVLERGLYTAHEMNYYTGALYPWLLALVFRFRGVGLLWLRLPGALCNAAALGFGSSWLPLLALGSAFYMCKSRLAWEVYAFQPLLLGASWWALSRKRGALFAALTVFGVQNHFIHGAVPLSLVLLFGHLEDRERQRAALGALAAAFAVFLVKSRLPAEGVPLWYLPLLASLPLLALAPWPFLRPPRALWWLLGAYAAWHGLAFIEAFSGPVVFKRMFSWDAPWWYDAPLYAWGAALLGLLCWRGARAWHRKDDALALWPFAYMCVFLLFRHTSSLRYYAPLHFISLLALADGLTRVPEADRRLWRAGAVAAALLVQVPLLREMASPADRRPFEFRVGWRLENSWDFARKEALFAAWDDSRACRMAQKNSFVDLPLFFHRASHPLDCVDASFAADYRADGGGPPWHVWRVEAPAR